MKATKEKALGLHARRTKGGWEVRLPHCTLETVKRSADAKVELREALSPWAGQAIVRVNFFEEKDVITCEAVYKCSDCLVPSAESKLRLWTRWDVKEWCELDVVLCARCSAKQELEIEAQQLAGERSRRAAAAKLDEERKRLEARAQARQEALRASGVAVANKVRRASSLAAEGNLSLMMRLLGEGKSESKILKRFTEAYAAQGKNDPKWIASRVRIYKKIAREKMSKSEKKSNTNKKKRSK